MNYTIKEMEKIGGFKKLDQFFVKPERPEPGLTATSASFLAALASQEVNRLEAAVKSSTFYDIYMELLSGSCESRLVQKGKDKTFLDALLPTATRIGELRGFMAYVHEAVKEKDRRLEYLDGLTFEAWLDLEENAERKAALEASADIKKPTAPARIPEADEEWAKMQLSVKDLAHYLLLEAKASTLGIYIHPEGALARAKDDLAEVSVKPIQSAGQGQQTTIRSFKPSIDPQAVYDNYNQLQQSQRVWEAELNTIKAKLQILAKNENLERNRIYREALVDYQNKLSAYEVATSQHNSLVQKMQSEYSDWLINENEKVRNLKIVVPHELQETYDYLSRLGK